jgi:hypothetical protein
MRHEIRTFLAADNARRLAVKSAEKAFRVAFPTGAIVQWMHGEYMQVGKVVMHGVGDRLKARNSATGREVWIDAYKIQLFYEAEKEPGVTAV